MQLRYIKGVLPPSDASLGKVSALAWSPNNQRLAVVTTDRVVHLFDENGDRRDKFSTKPAEKSTKAYLVTGMAFSPDSTRLAIAQSDNIVFVYKLGLDWADKKSICNKFPQTSGVSCICWPSARSNEVVFGLAEGKVKVGQMRTNKAATLYAADAHVVAVCSSPDGNAILAAHVDGSVYRFVFDDSAGGGPSHMKFCQHSCAPYALGWGAHILAAGCDGRVAFYDNDGGLQRTFDYSADPSVRDFTCAIFSPSGEAAVVGSYGRFMVYALSSAADGKASSGGAGASAAYREWQEASVRTVDNLYTVTALGWKADGSKLAVGNLTGAVDLYDACLKRRRYKGKFEFTYVSLSSVIVKRLSSGMRIVLRSSFGYEITRIRIFQDRYLIAHTPATLLMGDLESCKLSEIPWTSTPQLERGRTAPLAPAAVRERFFFDNSSVCMVYRAGELTLVEYGKTEALGTCRTEHMSPHLVSVRINDRMSTAERERALKLQAEAAEGRSSGQQAQDNKKIAYLLDAQTIRIMDLLTGASVATISHDSRIDWLELSGRGNLLLFWDKRRRLHVFDVARQVRSTLLSYCTYAQWVPDSDVVVAQRRNQLCVWYSVRAPEKMTVYDIKGDVEDIERANGRTEVLVDEGLTTASYQLDEGLIGFGTAMDDGDLEAACALLETLAGGAGYNSGPSSDVAAMWQQLSQAAMAAGELQVAERCAVALGDVSRARFLHKTLKIAALAASRMGGNGKDFWMVQARLAQLRSDVSGAESVFVKQGRIDDAIDMYQQLQRYEDAIAVAESHGRSDADGMRRQYMQYLVDSGQEVDAASLKERDGDNLGAIALFLRGGYPAKALSVVLANPVSFPRDVLEKITTALAAAGMYDKAGSLLERMGDHNKALEAYIRGKAFRPAVELARKQFAGRVVELEKAWGDYLVSQKQMDAAINHYIEAQAHTEAITAALDAGQFSKAAQLVQDTLSSSVAARPFWRRLAKHYAERNMLEEAEKFYLKADDGRAAVDMYLTGAKYDAAYRVARSFMSETEVTAMCTSQGQKLEAAGQLRAAEKLYVTAGALDSALRMYKRAKQYEAMVRLVGAHRPRELKDTHKSVARLLQEEGNLRGAEQHYVNGGEWESALSMYRQANQWEEAMRVARTHGGPSAAHKVAYAQAMSMGGEAGMKLLNRLGLMEQAIDYACEIGDWERAIEMATRYARDKLPVVHFQHAMHLEDVGQFAAAETEFVAADKPREAVDMYLHMQDFASALRVAENYDPGSVPDVLVAQGNAAVEARDYARAESLFVDAKRPELAVDAWIDAQGFADAARVAKRYLPHKAKEINDRIRQAMDSTGNPSPPRRAQATGGASPTSRSGDRGRGRGVGASADPLTAARTWESTGEYSMAIDSYLQVTTAKGHDAATCELAWNTATRLAAQFDRGRYVDVAEEVAHRLADMGRHEPAGDLFAELELFDKAAECFVQAGAWSKAKAAAKVGSPKLRESVEAAHKAALLKAGDPDSMVSAGAVDAALAVYASQGQWDKVFEVASKDGAGTLAKYLYPRVEDMLRDGKAEEVVALFARYGAPPVASQAPLYRRLVTMLFHAPTAQQQRNAGVYAQLRDCLYRVVSALRKSGVTDGTLPEFERLLLAVHYYTMRNRLAEMQLGDQATRVSISLLRYVLLLPADRAFFDAGMACRGVGMKGAALVLLNRFIDLAEAIEEGADDASALDNADFVGTGIPAPADIPLPRDPHVSARELDEAKDWVLTTSVDRSVQQVLPSRPCFSCSGKMFEGSLGCPSCKASFPACIITGYPIPATQMVTCSSCSSRALKAAWNVVVSKTKCCPWCAASASTVV